MEEIRQIQDDAVSSNDLNSGNLLNLANWDVGNATAFSEIYACTQEGDDDDVLPFEALLDSKSNDAANHNNETSWIDGSSSSCDNMDVSLNCVERDDFQVLQSLGVVENTNNENSYIFGNSKSSANETSSLLADSEDVSKKIQSEMNSNSQVIFLNSTQITKQLDKSPQFNLAVSRTTFENFVKNIKNNFINDINCFGQNANTRPESLFDMDVKGTDMIQKPFESNATENLAMGDDLCIDGTADVFGADESSNSFMDGSNHSAAESSNLQTQYSNQLVYADLSGSVSKDANLQNNGTSLLNSPHIPPQHFVISSEGQKIILQNQHKPNLLKQLAQQPSLTQHFILQQNSGQVFSPQLQTVFQQLKMPQQIIRTTFQKNLLETNLLSGHVALNKFTIEDQQGSNFMMGNIKSVKPSRSRNQVNRAGRNDATVGGKPNTTGPANEKDSQELERVMNILKHYKQQIASNDQESQFLPCKRKRSKPPENVASCTSVNISNNMQSKLVTSAVIPNLNLSFNLSVKSNDSKNDNSVGNSSIKTNSELGSILVSNSEHLNIITVSGSVSKALATSAIQTISNSLPTGQTSVTSTKSFLSSQCSQNFPFSLQLPASNALSRAQSLLNTLQSSTPTTLQLSIKNLTKLVGFTSGTSTVDMNQSNENVQTKMSKSSSPASGQQLSSQTSQHQQVINVSQALMTLQQLNSNQKLSSPQQILINSFLQKNLPQFLHLSVRQNSGAQSSAINSVSQHVVDISNNSTNSASILISDQQLAGSHSNSTSDKTSKVIIQLSNSSSTSHHVNSVVQSKKNDKSHTDDWDPTNSDNVVTPTNHFEISNHSNQKQLFPGDSKLNLTLPCNKVKMELTKKLKASPISRGIVPHTSTFKPLLFSVKTVGSPDFKTAPQQSNNSNIKEYFENKHVQESDNLETWTAYKKEKLEDAGLSIFENFKSMNDIKDFMRKSFKTEESAIRIEKLQKSEGKTDATSWDPTPKSILKRIGPEEKILCLVAPENVSENDDYLSIVGLVLWDGVEEQLVNSAFDNLFALFHVETDRKRKSRIDKSSNSCNVVWTMSEGTCCLKSTSTEFIPKQDRIKDSCEAVHQMARRVSEPLSKLLPGTNQNGNMWTEATLLSNNSEEFNPNSHDVTDIYCYVPLRCRTTGDSAKSRRDLGTWRVFPGCVLSRTEEIKDASLKRTNSGRNRIKLETQSSSFSIDQEMFLTREEVEISSKVQTNETRKLKHQAEEKNNRNDFFENEECWMEKDSSTNKRKRKLQDLDHTLKLKIKKINSDDKSSIETDDVDQEDDEDVVHRQRHQHYYCVRPRRQKSQRQIEHEQLQQQRLTRNCNSRSKQKQQRIEEEATCDGKRSVPKNKEAIVKGTETENKQVPDEISRTTNAETRSRLTMKLRDKINPRTSYASGVFMALTQGSVYFEVSKQNFNSTSLTNCSTKQLCLRLERRKPIDTSETAGSKLPCAVFSQDFNDFSDLIKQENDYSDSLTNSPSSVTHYVKKQTTEELTKESKSICGNTKEIYRASSVFESQDVASSVINTTAESNLLQTPVPKLEIPDAIRQLPSELLSSSCDIDESRETDSIETKVKIYTASAPVNCAITMTTDTLVTKWIKPKLATTGPYPCWD